MIEDKVREILASKLGRAADTIHLEDDLLKDLGLDSLALAELIVLVDQFVGGGIPGEQLLDATTVGDIVRLLAAHSGRVRRPIASRGKCVASRT